MIEGFVEWSLIIIASVMVIRLVIQFILIYQILDILKKIKEGIGFWGPWLMGFGQGQRNKRGVMNDPENMIDQGKQLLRGLSRFAVSIARNFDWIKILLPLMNRLLGLKKTQDKKPKDHKQEQDSDQSGI